jgi:hypothetical protein
MNVLVSIPNQGWIHKLVLHAAMRLVADRTHAITLITPTWRPYEHNMNRIAKDFLAGPYDAWLNIDADNPPLRNPLDNVGSPHGVIGYPTPVWHDGLAGSPLYWNAMTAKDDGYVASEPGDGLTEVDAVGTGCALFTRDVVAAVRQRCGAPFVRTVDADGLVEFGPDFLFCRRAKELGYTIAADFERPCRHFSEIDLLTAAERYTSG